MQISKDPKNQIKEPENQIKDPKIQIASNSKQINIHERIYAFVLEVIKLTQQLQKNPSNIVIVNQILRSATSVGANDQEADAAESRKDFIAKYTIAKKELKETSYWLKLINDTNQTINNDIKTLRNESEELLRIISTIIINTKNKH